MGKKLDKLFLILDTFYGLKYGYDLGRKINLLERLPERWEAIDRKYIPLKINYMKRRGYLTSDKNEKRYYRLTPKGLIKLIRLKAAGEKLASRKSPGISDIKKLVFFDIPENRRKDRNRLRFFLKELGFRELQKSIFLSGYDCEKELSAILDFLNLKEFVISGIFYPDKTSVFPVKP